VYILSNEQIFNPDLVGSGTIISNPDLDLQTKTILVKLAK
jgi:hypothetical protein